MAGIFVNGGDGGVGPAGASNSFTPHFEPSCDALFYPNTCTARVTGAWLNAILSEIGQAVDNAGLTIDCGRTDNLNRALMTHGQTVGYCGPDRASAEAQKGAPFVPGDYWLNTTTGTVYVVDQLGNDWALPNQPAAFLCCDGSQWARCGSGYSLVISRSGTQIDIAACPDGPVDADMDLQSAICALSSGLASGGGAPTVVAENYGGRVTGTRTYQRRLNTIYNAAAANVSLNASYEVVFNDAGTYLIEATATANDYAWSTERLWIVDQANNTVLGTNHATIGDTSYGPMQVRNMLIGEVTLTAGTRLRLLHYLEDWAVGTISTHSAATMKIWRTG